MKIDFGKCELQLRNCTVPIESESYLNSLVWVASQKILKPQTATVVWGKFRGQRNLNRRKQFSVTAINTGILALEPGLMVTNTVIKVGKNRFPFLICNSTNRTLRLKRGNVVAQVEEVSGDCILYL